MMVKEPLAEKQLPGLSGKIGRNALANYLGQFVAMAISFLVTPYIVRQLGDSQYGIWGLAGSITAYLTLLDLGFSSGTARFVARYEGQGRRQDISVLVSTMWLVYCGLGAVALVGAALVMTIAPLVFNIEAGLVTTARLTLLLAGLHLAISLPTSLLGAVLVGEQRIDLNNAATIISRLIEAPLGVGLVSVGWGAPALAVAAIVATSLAAAIRWGLIRRTFSWLRIHWRRFDRYVLRQVFGYSSYVFGLQVTGLIAFNTDNIVLASFLSTADITPFALCYKLANLLTVVTSPFVSVFFPAFAELDGRADLERSRRLFIEGTRIACASSLAVGIVLLLGGDHILRVWVGQEYVPYFGVLQLLALSNLTIAALGSSSSNLLLGYGNVKGFFWITVGHSLTNLALSLLLVRPLRSFGVALGTMIPVVAANLVFIFPLACRTLGLSTRQGYRRIVWPTLWPAMIAGGIYIVLGKIALLAERSLLRVAILILGYGLLYIFISLNKEQRASYWRYAFQFIRGGG